MHQKPKEFIFQSYFSLVHELYVRTLMTWSRRNGISSSTMGCCAILF